MKRSQIAVYAITLAVVVVTASRTRAEETTTEAPQLRAPTRSELAERLDAYLKPLVEQDQIFGRLLVRKRSETPIIREFGWANAELGVAVGADSKFNIASVTKTMTMIALAALIDEEKLALDDSISKWLPDFPQADKITVEMVARHRAGIPHRVMDSDDENVPRTAADMVELAAAKGLDFEPGERESYSSGGYSVLARVMELASGSSYQQLLERHVFKPAAMTMSRHVDSREVFPGRVSSYLIDITNSKINAPLKDLSFLVGAGSVWSTAEDLTRMVDALRDSRYRPAASENLLRESGFRSNGRTSGFRTFVDWHRELDLTVVFTGNLVTGAADLLREGVPRLAAGEQLAPPSIPKIVAVDLDPSILVGYEGFYELRPGRTLEVTAIPGGLQIESWILIAIGEKTFVSPQDYAIVEFLLENDRPVKMDWTTSGRTFELPRVK